MVCGRWGPPRAGKDEEAARKSFEVISVHVFSAVAVTALFAGAAYGLGMVSRGGALGGFAAGVFVYISLGWRGFAILALFVVGGSALTRLGYGRKRRWGRAEARGGRRGARNAFANCTVAVACALLSALTPYHQAFAAAFVAALGAAFADTAESEVGQLASRSPRLITSMREVRPGTDGAVSPLGTLAGVVAAGITACSGFALGLVEDVDGALLVALAAFLGTVADSLIGAMASRLGNEATNLICTLVAALVALALA